MDRVPVTSSNVASVGWADGVLEVGFLNGGVYAYQGVPEAEYQALVGAASVGGYLAKHIKGAYPYAKVPDMPSPPEPDAATAGAVVDDADIAEALAGLF